MITSSPSENLKLHLFQKNRVEQKQSFTSASACCIHLSQNSLTDVSALFNVNVLKIQRYPFCFLFCASYFSSFYFAPSRKPMPIFTLSMGLHGVLNPYVNWVSIPLFTGLPDGPCPNTNESSFM